MKELIKQVNSLPLIVKLLLCIPCIEIFYGICRIINGINKENLLWVVLGILTIIPGAAFMWIVDIIYVLLFGHAFLLGDSLLG
jgi:hypothetical protein